MPITFDPVNKLIKITSPTTNVAAQTLYSESMNWAEELENIIYDVPMDANGKFELGTGIHSDVIYRLLSGWKLKWFDGDKTVSISGTLITDNNTSRTVPADSGNVEMTFQVSSSGTIEQTDVSIGSFINDDSPEANDFNGNNSLSSLNDFYNNSMLVFTTGELKGITRKISDYNGSTRTFKFLGSTNSSDAPFPIAPNNGDKFKILGRMV